MNAKQRWQDWVNLVLGVWLFISPFVGLGAVNSVIAWNSYVFGVAIVIFAIWALARPQQWEEWINFLIGLWLIISPFVLTYYATQQGPATNHIIVGILVAGGAIWAALQRPMGPGRQVGHH